MWHGAVCALAFNLNAKRIARGHDGAGRQTKAANRHSRPVMHAENSIHMEAVKQAVINHSLGTPVTFLSRLEDDMYGAFEIAVFCQVAGGCEKHGGVAIVPAGVHLALVTAGVLECI